VNLGPLAISDKGVDVRPKMDIGVAYGNFYCNAGVGDVRDSLSFGLDANVNQQFHASGIGLKQFLANLKAQDGIADDYINPLMQQSNKIVAEVLRLIDMDIRGAHIDGVMKMETGFGFHGSASLGWRDTEGYHMVGAGGKIATGLHLSISLFAGAKSNREIKVIIGAANYGIRMKIRSEFDMRAEDGKYDRLVEESDGAGQPASTGGSAGTRRAHPSQRHI